MTALKRKVRTRKVLKRKPSDENDNLETLNADKPEKEGLGNGNSGKGKLKRTTPKMQHLKKDTSKTPIRNKTIPKIRYLNNDNCERANQTNANYEK